MNSTTTFDLETLLAESEIEMPVNLLDDEAEEVEGEEDLDEVSDDDESSDDEEEAAGEAEEEV